MKRRKQAGTIILRSGKWYASYWERRNVNGSVERKRVTHYLGEKTTRGKHPPDEIVADCEKFMATINANNQTVKPEHVVSITQFVDSVYMPWVRANKRPATTKGYENIWKTHLKDHFGNLLLRDYQPSNATVFLTKLAEKRMGLNSLNHVRALMSGIFKHAAALGYINSESNPPCKSAGHANGTRGNPALHSVGDGNSPFRVAERIPGAHRNGFGLYRAAPL